MQLSFLSDYSEAEVDELFTIAPEYSGEATLCEEVPNVKDEVSLQIPEHELKDSLSAVAATEKKTCTTSWATQAIRAADFAYEQKGYKEKFSVRYLYQCMTAEYGGESDDGCNGFTNNEIYAFIEYHGLMMEKDAQDLDDLCSPDNEKNNIKFAVQRLTCSNKYTLMDALSQNHAMVVLLALDDNRARHIRDISAEEDAPYTGASDQPSTWAITTGYKLDGEEGTWSLQSDFALDETVKFKLPIRNNDTNANYAGIAAFAYYLEPLAPTAEPTEVPTDAPQPPTEVPAEPTTEAPVEPTTEAPQPPTEVPAEPTTEAPIEPTTEAPAEPTTEAPTEAPTTEPPTTEPPTTLPPTTLPPTTLPPTTLPPTTLPPRKVVDCPTRGMRPCKEVVTAIDDPETVTDLELCRCTGAIDYSMFPNLRTLRISFMRDFGDFYLENMKELTNVIIGEMGDTTVGGKCDANSTVVISHNPKLADMIIEVGAFQKICTMEIEGNEELANLGIGAKYDDATDSYSYTVFTGAFSSTTDAVIADMPKLENIQLGGSVMYTFENLRIENLPILKTFHLFASAMQGNDAGASMVMRSKRIVEV